MTYSWEWLSDLALIPAWEIGIIGVILGAILTLLILATTRDSNDK